MSEDEHHHHPCQGGGHQPSISCREISEFLLAYVERELEGDVHDEFERHLQLCPPCGHYLDGYRDTVELVRTCAKAEVDPATKRSPPPEDLVQAILAAKQRMVDDGS